MTKEDILKRLAYIKYLYKAGVEQSKQPEIIAYTSVLSFHDAIDWFMNLACLKKGISEKDKKSIIGKQQIFLMDYFTILPELTLAASVEKINTRRNNLKHSFQIPAQVEIEECKGVATLFFEENTKIVFEIDFNDISLYDLITFPEIRQRVIDADKSFKENDKKSGIIGLTMAFYRLIQSDNRKKRAEFGYNYTGITTWGFHHVNVGQIRNKEIKESLYPITDHIDKVTKQYDENFDNISESLNIIGLGLDFRKYTKFKFLTPPVYESFDDPIVTMGDPLGVTEEHIQFMFDFIIESALIVQRFDYSITKK
ncbi:MAG: hypothetical protein JNN00_17710 [Chitinophagaceae bacterium]|nr:hypothetical protein [Chitinophagaceae bacterium]